MTTLILALTAVAAAALWRVGAFQLEPRGAHVRGPRRRVSDLVADWALGGALAMRERIRRWLDELSVVARIAAAALIQPELGLSPDLARAIGSEPVAEPAFVAAVRRELAKVSAEITAPLEARFAPRLPEPGQARLAARLFVASLALACSGVVGLVSTVAPEGVLHFQPAAAMLGKRAVQGVTDTGLAEAAVAGPVVTPATPAPSDPPATSADPTTSSSEPPTTAVPAPAPPPPPPSAPNARGALPVGKGMWIWMPDKADGGNVDAIVARAQAVGLTHIYVQTGSSTKGLVNMPFIDALLPKAHAAGIRVFGWDFPELNDPGGDTQRAWQAISHKSPEGLMLDGFAADIETHSEGTNNDADNVFTYTSWVRQAAGDGYPLIACVPDPTPARRTFPYREAIANFDAFAPMVYWLNRDPGADVTNAIQYLSQFGKPIFPVGQAYDGQAEGGHPGPPAPEEIIKFMQAAWAGGSPGASFWEWNHAPQPTWDVIGLAGEFRLVAGDGTLPPGMIRSYQVLLNGLGFAVPTDGKWSDAMKGAVTAYQQAAHLPVTGAIDDATKAMLFTPTKLARAATWQ